MAETQECVFCRIARGEIPARLAYQDEEALAFHDISPQAPVHLLVVPRRHIADLEAATDADRGLLGHLWRVAARVAAQLGFAGAGYRVVLNNGRDANQIVPHLHLHVLAGRRLGWPPG